MTRYLAILAAFAALACSPPPSPTDASSDAGSMGSDATDAHIINDGAIDAIDDASADGEADASLPPPEARPPAGPLRGTRGRGFQAFLGIPYAEPPVGDRRWRSPVAKAPWTNVRDAITPGAACAQSGLGNNLGAEDCLFINVHTPDPRPTNAPVMVWIHGGAFVFGEGLQTDRGTAGDILAQRYGMVVVSMNYRLGNFGFFTSPSIGANGNQGFEDQQLALRWVRDNVSAFGGDPNNVTIVGESAGGISVCLHLVAPASQGLYRRAVSQSGLCDSALPTRAQAEMAGTDVVRSLGCDTAPDLGACMRGKTMPEVRTAGALGGNVFATLLASTRSSWPSIDGTVLPGQFRERVTAGSVADVPMIFGWNRDEGTLFVALAELGGTMIQESTRAMVLDSLASQSGVDRAAIDAQYPRSRYSDVRLAIAEPLGHFALACPSRRAAKLLAERGRTVFTYRFDFPDAAFQLPPDWALGAFHSAEIQFVFGRSARVGMPRFNAEQSMLHLAMSGYWARFVRGGDPNGDGAVPWMPRTMTAERSLVIDRTFAMRDNVDRDPCALWDR
ncbi:MAG: carboxylesterase family protein [Myxococcales bacterium]|nr:carboxylesterase family protein [Myxococcales bacterium]